MCAIKWEILYSLSTINIFIPIQYLKKIQFDLLLTSVSLGLLNHILLVVLHN